MLKVGRSLRLEDVAGELLHSLQISFASSTADNRSPVRQTACRRPSMLGLPELERLEIVLARASRSKTKPCDVLAELIHDTLEEA